MQIIFVLLSALLPVVIALWYIFRKDSAQPEPARWLVKAFWYGILSTVLSFAFSVPAGELFGLELQSEVYPSVIDAFADAFLLAAIPEELAKLIMLWLLLRKNPYFDEKFDGIVYAVCIGMGFAGLENVMYLVEGLEDGSWLSVGISRALFTIPGHFFFAVLMGYYYSLSHFGVKHGFMNRAMVFVAPVLAHGVFDAFLFCTKVNEVFAVIGLVLFLFFFSKLKKMGTKRINNLMNR